MVFILQIKELTRAKNDEVHQKQQIQSELAKIKSALATLKTNETQYAKVNSSFENIQLSCFIFLIFTMNYTLI